MVWRKGNVLMNMKRFLNIAEHRFCFEFYSVDIPLYFFNINDYYIYDENEKQELIYNELYSDIDFLQIPQLNRDTIVYDFLKAKNELRLLRLKDERDFFGLFHNFYEENWLRDEWYEFEKAALIEFAREWCNNNGIKFSEKQTF